jgi:hypothetical protein
MKLLDSLLRSKKTLPPLAGGAPGPDERLLSDAQYMEPRAAESVTRWVQSWRAMPSDEFEECARHL